jgi:hypothetical protein
VRSSGAVVVGASRAPLEPVVKHDIESDAALTLEIVGPR